MAVIKYRGSVSVIELCLAKQENSFVKVPRFIQRSPEPEPLFQAPSSGAAQRDVRQREVFPMCSGLRLYMQ